ncbi:MAG: hypothetical protein ABIJ27_05740 [Candidatus Omnitrophota bacterium]
MSKTHKLYITLAAIVSISISICGSGEAYTVGTLLDDWGVAPGTWNSSSSANNSDWTPSGNVQYIVEDQTGGTNAYLNPGWGGQRYDVEAIYFVNTPGTAYLSIVTGFRSSGYSGWAPGDIAIDLGSDGTYDLGIITTGAEQHASCGPGSARFRDRQTQKDFHRGIT